MSKVSGILKEGDHFSCTQFARVFPFAGVRSIAREFVMADIQNPRLLYLKGALFVALGAAAAALLVFENPTWRTVGLLCVTIWAFSRAYYFVFYVIEHYIDGSYRFAGLWSFVQYLRRSPRGVDSTIDRE